MAKAKPERPENEVQFIRMYEMYFGLVVHILHRLGLTIEDCKDIAQNTFLSIWRCYFLPNKPVDHPMALVRRVLHSRRIDHWRKSEPTTALPSDIEAPDKSGTYSVDAMDFLAYLRRKCSPSPSLVEIIDLWLSEGGFDEVVMFLLEREGSDPTRENNYRVKKRLWTYLRRIGVYVESEAYPDFVIEEKTAVSASSERSADESRGAPETAAKGLRFDRMTGR